MNKVILSLQHVSWKEKKRKEASGRAFSKSSVNRWGGAESRCSLDVVIAYIERLAGVARMCLRGIQIVEAEDSLK